MRFLGIDYGEKRIGLAISNENNTMAFPKEIISSGKDAVFKIDEILKKENITDVVVGESLNFSGIPNKINEHINLFISKLQVISKVKIHREKEFLTSVEARKMGNTKNTFQKSESHSKMKKERIGKIDASAAALILQRFLDRIK